MKVSTVNFITNESLALGVFLKKLRSFFECIIYKTPLDDLGMGKGFPLKKGQKQMRERGAFIVRMVLKEKK